MRELGLISVDDYINVSVIEVRNKVNYKLNVYISFEIWFYDYCIYNYMIF